jgi:aspartyl-tRNA(Asn)/glutamyl-tRNA(Gln) amidotransferase subunit A
VNDQPPKRLPPATLLDVPASSHGGDRPGGLFAALDERYRAGLSPVDLVDGCLQLADRVAPHTYLRITAARARTEAAASAARYDRRRPLGPLDGIPVTVKDVFAVAGTPTTAASPTRRADPDAIADADVLALTRAAGAVCLGTTNMSEFAFSALGVNPAYGTPQPPHAPDRIPGGSSSGAAIAVATGSAAASIGSDTSGSIRVPAAFNGLIGYRPTQNRYSRNGMFALAPSLDTVGTITRSVADTIALDRVLHPEERTRTELDSELTTLVVPLNGPAEDLDATVGRGFAAALDALTATGRTIRRAVIQPMDRAQQLMDDRGTLVAAEAYQRHAALLEEPARSQVDPRIIERLERAASITVSDYARLLTVRRELISQLPEDIGEDVIVCPTVKFVAPRLADLQADAALFGRVNEITMRNTRLFSFLDMPAITIPCPRRIGTLPASITIAAAPGRDEALLLLARHLESVLRQADQLPDGTSAQRGHISSIEIS